MGSTFVNVGAHGFWTLDGVLELWLRLLALHLDPPTQPGSVVGAIRDQFLLASTGGFVGCVPHGLEEAVATPEGAAAVRGASETLLACLEAVPSSIPAPVLQLLGIAVTFTADIAASDVADVGRAFIDLLDGKVSWTAADSPVFPA